MNIVDEREQIQRGASAYATIMALGTAYVAVGAYSAITKINPPFTVELLAGLGLLTYFYTIIKNDGFSFGHKWLIEDDRTLSQSTAARSIPWTILVGSQALALMSLLDAIRYGQLLHLVPMAIVLVLGYLLAKGVKSGHTIAVGLLKLMGSVALINVVGIALIFSVIFFATEMRELSNAIQGWNAVATKEYSWGITSALLIQLWPLLGAWKYGKELKK